MHFVAVDQKTNLDAVSCFAYHKIIRNWQFNQLKEGVICPKKNETTLTACNKVSALTNQHNFNKLILPMTSVCVMHIKSLGYISNEKWALLSDRPCYNSHS